MSRTFVRGFVLIPLLMTALAGSFTAHGVDFLGVPLVPLVEVGGGVEVNSEESGVNGLIRVTLGASGTEAGSEIFKRVYLLRLKGDVIFDGDALKGLDVEFMPIAFSSTDPGQLHNPADPQMPSGEGLEMGLLPTRVTRDVRLDNKATVQIDVLRLNVALPLTRTPMPYEDDYNNGARREVVVYARVVADMLGYKLAKHFSETANYHALSVVDLDASLGILWTPGNAFRGSLVVGGRADFSVGAAGSNIGVASDAKAYARVVADIVDLIRLFAEIQVGTRVGSPIQGEGSQSSVQALFGAEILF